MNQPTGRVGTGDRRWNLGRPASVCPDISVEGLEKLCGMLSDRRA